MGVRGQENVEQNVYSQIEFHRKKIDMTYSEGMCIQVHTKHVLRI